MIRASNQIRRESNGALKFGLGLLLLATREQRNTNLQLVLSGHKKGREPPLTPVHHEEAKVIALMKRARR